MTSIGLNGLHDCLDLVLNEVSVDTYKELVTRGNSCDFFYKKILTSDGNVFKRDHDRVIGNPLLKQSSKRKVDIQGRSVSTNDLPVYSIHFIVAFVNQLDEVSGLLSRSDLQLSARLTLHLHLFRFRTLGNVSKFGSS